MRILVVENFTPDRRALSLGLTEAGYAVDSADNSEDGLRHAQAGEFDVIILDDTTLLRMLRKRSYPAHILMLSAKGSPEECIRCLDLGADDHMSKPFVFGELLARIRALIRRKFEARNAALHVGDLEIDPIRRTVSNAGRPIGLTGREYALLEYLAFNTTRVVSRADINQHVYGLSAKAKLESNVVDAFVKLLRKKIERQGKPRLLHTHRGQGYRLTELGKSE